MDAQHDFADLRWLIAAGYEVSIEAGEHDGGAEVCTRLDRHYEDEPKTFWGSPRDALAQARAWSEENGVTP